MRNISEVRDFLRSHMNGALSKTLIRPVEVLSPEGTVVNINFIARNSKEGRIRLYEKEGSKPMELSHCAGVVSAFNDYCDEVKKSEAFQRKQNLMDELSHYAGMSSIETLNKCGFSYSEKERLISEELDEILKGTKTVNLDTVTENYLVDLLNTAKNIDRNNEYYNKFEFLAETELINFTPIERARYWWYQGMKSRYDLAWALRDVWSSSNRFKEDVPVFYDVWIRSEERMKEFSEHLIKEGFTTMKFVDNSSACLSHLRMLINLGWKVDKPCRVVTEYGTYFDGVEVIHTN